MSPFDVFIMKKRYLFIEGQLNSGGAERVLLEVLQNFDYEANEVFLLQVNAGGTLFNEIPPQVKVLSAWPGYTLGYSFAYRCSTWFGCDFFLRRQLLRVTKGMYFDVAISFLEGMPLKMHAMITEIADRNYSWVHVDLDNYRYEVGQFRVGEEIRAYNKMDGVVCVASDTANAFKRRFPDCTTLVQVIYNPIDAEKISNLGEEFQVPQSSCFKVAVCGRLSEQKKLDRVIRLARRIKDAQFDIKIQLIGDGDLRDELMKLCELSGVEDIVEFLGFQRNPFPYVKASDMLLSTSGYEGFSLVICEAMALGVPVVATKTAGPMEILDNDKYGLLCDHDDESIYQAVKRMYEDAELRRHYSEVGKERVSEFSVERTMAAIYKL